jgi:hypothetical protein
MTAIARSGLILALVLMAGPIVGCSDEPAASEIETEVVPTDVPTGIVSLIDDWYTANERADGSVMDLYVPEGYHLYGDQRYDYDDVSQHLSAGGDSYEHEWLTDPLLIAADEDGRYVVVRGLRNSSPAWSNASALLFEVVTTSEGEFRIVQTAWFYDSEW